MTFRSQIRKVLLATMIAAPMLILPVEQARAGIFVSVNFAPPAIPVYVQPPLPAPGYIWTPGYWAYGDAGYYWVPGVWVEPPSVGVLWTPGYWGFNSGAYGWHAGYWGPHVGFYGGVNYGFGYGGIGFCGGEWRGGAFAYNRAVANFGSVHVTNVYEDRTIVNRTTIINNNHVSYNGGNGIQARPTAEEMRAANERHIEATSNQREHESFAARDRAQLAAVNHGRPAMAAASNVNEYHRVAEEHAKSQPISGADKAAGAHYNPNNREGNQDQRIANGERSGKMTSGEAARADKTQSRIDQQVHNDRAANGGKLTPQERTQINKEQNNASKQIYNEKHNENTVKPNEVNNREANQQQRTANGLHSGQTTSGEAARTNNNQAKVDSQVHNERSTNGGALTAQQHAQINREQKQNSRQIQNQNHNTSTYRPAPAAKPAPAPRPQAESRPVPAVRPAPAPRTQAQSRPVPAVRPAPAPRPMAQSRPAPAVRPAPRHAPRPQAHPTARPMPRPVAPHNAPRGR